MIQKITKAIIPVAGWGTRRLPITKIIEKSMLPVGNRPLVDYSVQELIKAGVTEIFMVISDTEPCQVKQFYSENKSLNEYLTARGKSDRLALAKTLPDHVKIRYIKQDPSAKYGTAVPVALVAKKYKIDAPVLLFMGDDFIWNPTGESASASLINSLESDTDSAILGIEIPKSEVEKYGVIEHQNHVMTDIIEKPKPADAPSNLINVSKYILSPELINEIVEYVDTHDFSPEDQEYVITDPLNSYIKKGGIVRVAKNSGQYLDGGSVAGWVHANNVVCGCK